ncbi:MAG: hypothetical protein MI924_06335 [Chloroflexales bacterium]|nr:hypothetical protein [Chloroflexales bacterium]
MRNERSALILAQSDRLRNSLLVLLRAIPQLDHISAEKRLLAAPAGTYSHSPELVVLDCDGASPQLLLQLVQLRACWPQTRLIALVDHEMEQHAVQDAGADVALIKGVLAARLLTTIETLLDE